MKNIFKENKKLKEENNMLRIKSDVDLKELEKFGFKRYYDEDFHRYSEYELEIDDIVVTISFERILYIWGEDYKCIGNHQLCIDKGLTPLYDLITAGLVEKIEERN